ncbi:MAG: rhodanese-like domain-containing protein [Terriglobia bacterium]
MGTFSVFGRLRVAILVALAGAIFLPGGRMLAAGVRNPWPQSQLLAPQALATEIRAKKSPQPVIVCVGFQFEYQAAHIPGALLKGPARTSAGIRSLTEWARSVPKNSPVVIYCGCCPFAECPNIRPAYVALRRVGLTHVRVLYLEHSFLRDWIRRGYPVQRMK